MVVDTNAAVLSAVSNEQDVITVCGNGAAYVVQREAGVQHADLVIAVFDGKKGGTAYTVNYARKKNRDLWIIDPQDRSVTKEEGLFSEV